MDTTSTDRNTTFFRFEDLRVYHKSLDYINWVFSATNKIKITDNCNLIGRFNESARSIAINIAEGSARNKSQFIYYLKMAKSSVRECLVYTSTLRNSGLIDNDQDDESRNYLMEMTKMIGALISSLQRGPGGRHHDDIDNDRDEDEE